MILEKVNSPEDLKKLSRSELPQLCEELRAFLVQSVSQTGGHLASNLGAVELTVPQAAMIRLTPPPIRKRQSCSAYFSMVSRLRVP